MLYKKIMSLLILGLCLALPGRASASTFGDCFRLGLGLIVGAVVTYRCHHKIQAYVKTQCEKWGLTKKDDTTSKEVKKEESTSNSGEELTNTQDNEEVIKLKEELGNAKKENEIHRKYWGYAHFEEQKGIFTIDGYLKELALSRDYQSFKPNKKLSEYQVQNFKKIVPSKKSK